MVKRRIKALKNIQLKATNIEADFYKEVQALECKYHKLYTPLYEQVSRTVLREYSGQNLSLAVLWMKLEISCV